MTRSTDLIHHPYRPPEGFESVPVAVHKASTVLFPDVAAMRSRRWVDKSGYTYGLHGTPTTFTLEARIATLEGAKHALLAPSGLAAIVLVDSALLSAGDELLLPDNAYGPGKDFARHELARWGIVAKTYDPMDPSDLRRQITPRTRLVWLEAPGSVSLEFPDLPALLSVCREHELVTALDNTWGAGLAFDAFDLPGPDGARLGVDLSIHALTKYPSGGADVLMGAVCTRDTALYERLAHTHARLGHGVGAQDVELVLRGLDSLHLRYAAQDQAARTLAERVRGLPGVRRVLHPALPGSPGHAQWKAVGRAAAGLFSVEFDAHSPGAKVDALVDRLRLFRIGYSWGGPMSLAVPYHLASMRERATEITGPLVRFAVGLEAVDDLWDDLTQAWATLKS